MKRVWLYQKPLNRYLVSALSPANHTKWGHQLCVSVHEQRPKRLLSTNLEAKIPKGSLSRVIDANFYGFGQVLFCNNSLSGKLIFAGLCYGDPALASFALTGCIAATATSHLLDVEKDKITSGLQGYNGALVGCAMSAFSGLAMEPCLLATALAGASSAWLSSKVGPLMSPVPQWTLSFNAIALASLMCLRPLADAEPVTTPVVTSSLSILDWLGAPLAGISQIFIVNDPVAGAVILSGLALHSPYAALAAFLGSTMGALVALASGFDSADICDGLYSFNPALTALAISVFFVPQGAKTIALLFVGSAATCLLGVGYTNLFSECIQLPAFTLPFCTAASACFLLGGRVRGLHLASRPHSPEQNLRHWRLSQAS